MILYNFDKTIVLTKCNSICVSDGDGHNFWIHEDDIDIFNSSLEKGEDDGYELFDFYFGNNRCGGDPNEFRKQHLK